MAKCGFCKTQIAKTKFSTGECFSFGGMGYKTVNHLCPNCDAILSVEIDPVAVRSETIRQIKALLEGR